MTLRLPSIQELKAQANRRNISVEQLIKEYVRSIKPEAPNLDVRR